MQIENVTNTSLWPQLSPALRVVQPSCASPKPSVAPDSAKPPRMAEKFGTLMGFNWIYIMGLLYLKRIAQQLAVMFHLYNWNHSPCSPKSGGSETDPKKA